MDDPVTVVIPVGPKPFHKRWLQEAIESVEKQTYRVNQLLIIDDMADLPSPHPWGEHINVNVWKSPWLLGVAHAFNFGVALAKNDLVFMLGSDDWIEPSCIYSCVEAWKDNKKKDAYYFVGVRYDDGRKDPYQTVPCGEAMVTKGLWKATGGFPIESTSGACDAALISILMRNHPEWLVPVAGGAPLCNYHVHSNSDTAGRGNWQGIILQTRDILTTSWVSPTWDRKL